MTTPALQERFQTLVDEHKKILYKVCNSYCRNRDDREDLAQEIVIQLWQSFGSFDERYRFSTWMYRICLNELLAQTGRSAYLSYSLLYTTSPLCRLPPYLPRCAQLGSSCRSS